MEAIATINKKLLVTIWGTESREFLTEFPRSLEVGKVESHASSTKNRSKEPHKNILPNRICAFGVRRGGLSVCPAIRLRCNVAHQFLGSIQYWTSETVTLTREIPLKQRIIGLNNSPWDLDVPEDF